MRSPAVYRKYVEEGIATDNLGEISTGEITSIIGSDSFKDRIVKKYLVRDLSDIDDREQSVLRMLNAPSVEDVLDVVSTYFKIGNLEEITCRRGCNPDARKSAMYLAGKHCRKRETLTSIAKTFGLKISGLNMARNKFEIDLKSNKLLNRKIMDMENILRRRAATKYLKLCKTTFLLFLANQALNSSPP